MHSKNNFFINLTRWWASPNLPDEHIFIKPNQRPKGVTNVIRLYSRRWLIHPLKRRLAKYYLVILRKFFNLYVIGITGSAGKTTTKEMTVSILKNKGETIASYENIDPVYNIPMTILKCKPSTKYLVLEMGVEYPGEMDFYLWLAQPNVGVLTNIFPTHTEFFHDIEGVAKEKSKLIKSIPVDGFAILNNEDTRVRTLQDKIKAKVVLFGTNGQISSNNMKITKDLKTKYTLVIEKNKINVQIPAVGRQFVLNSLAAAATGYICGVAPHDIKEGLESYQKPKHRMEIFFLRNGALLIDDTYNNNPEAAKKTLKVFSEIAADRIKIVVFGDMLELGRWEARYHKEIGKVMVKTGVNFLIGVGKASRETVKQVGKGIGKKRVFCLETKDEVLPILKPIVTKNSAILIKGSRSIGLDKVVSDLLADAI